MKDHDNLNHEDYDFLLSSPLIFDCDDNTATIVEEIVLEKFQDKLEQIYDKQSNKVTRRRNKSGPGRIGLHPLSRRSDCSHQPFTSVTVFGENCEYSNDDQQHGGNVNDGNGFQSQGHKIQEPEELFFYERKVTLTKYKSDTSLNQIPSPDGSSPSPIQLYSATSANAKNASKEVHRDHETTAVYREKTTPGTVPEPLPLVYNNFLQTQEHEKYESASASTESQREHAVAADADVTSKNTTSTGMAMAKKTKTPSSGRTGSSSTKKPQLPSSSSEKHGRGPEFYLAPFSPTAAATVTGAKTIVIRYKPKKLASVSSSASLLSDEYDSQSTSVSMSPSASPSPDPAQLDKWALEPRTPSPSPEELQFHQNEGSSAEPENQQKSGSVVFSAEEVEEVKTEIETQPESAPVAVTPLEDPAAEISEEQPEKIEVVPLPVPEPMCDRTDAIRKEIDRVIQQAFEIDNALNEPVVKRKSLSLASVQLSENDEDDGRARNEKENKVPLTQNGSLSLEKNEPEAQEAVDVIDDSQLEKSHRDREGIQQTPASPQPNETKPELAPEYSSSERTRPRTWESRTMEVKICMVKVTREETQTRNRKSLYNIDAKSTDLDWSDSESGKRSEPPAPAKEPSLKDMQSHQHQHSEPEPPANEQQETPTNSTDAASKPPAVVELSSKDTNPVSDQHHPNPSSSEETLSKLDENQNAQSESEQHEKSIKGSPEDMESGPLPETSQPQPTTLPEQETETKIQPYKILTEKDGIPASAPNAAIDTPVVAMDEVEAKIEDSNRDLVSSEPIGQVLPQSEKTENRPEVEETPVVSPKPVERKYAAVAAGTPVPKAPLSPAIDPGLKPSVSPKHKVISAKILASVPDAKAKAKSKLAKDESTKDPVKVKHLEDSKFQSAPEATQIREPAHDIKPSRARVTAEPKPKSVSTVKVPETCEETPSTPTSSPSPSPSMPRSKSRKKKAKKTVTFGTDVDIDNDNNNQPGVSKSSKASNSKSVDSKFKTTKKCLTNSLPAGSPVPVPTGGYLISLISDTVLLCCELILCVAFIVMCFTSASSGTSTNLTWLGCASFLILLLPTLMSSSNRPEHRHRLPDLLQGQWPNSSLVQFAGKVRILHPILWTGMHYKTARAYTEKSDATTLSKFAQVRQFYREHTLEDGPGLIGRFFLQTLLVLMAVGLASSEHSDGGSSIYGICAVSGFASGLAVGRWTWLRVRTQGRLVLD